MTATASQTSTSPSAEPTTAPSPMWFAATTHTRSTAVRSPHSTPLTAAFSSTKPTTPPAITSATASPLSVSPFSTPRPLSSRRRFLKTTCPTVSTASSSTTPSPIQPLSLPIALDATPSSRSPLPSTGMSKQASIPLYATTNCLWYGTASPLPIAAPRRPRCRMPPEPTPWYQCRCT